MLELWWCSWFFSIFCDGGIILPSYARKQNYKKRKWPFDPDERMDDIGCELYVRWFDGEKWYIVEKQKVERYRNKSYDMVMGWLESEWRMVRNGNRYI